MNKLVIHMIDRLPPDGAERLIVEVLKNRSDRYRFEVVALVDGGRLVADLEAMGVPVTILGRRNGHDLRHAWALYKLLRTKRPHIVHTHLFTADAWGRTFAWLARIPGIFSTVHSTNAWKSKYHLRVDKLLAKVSDKVIACTADVMRTIGTQGITEPKVVNIPNGVDLDRIQNAPMVDIQREFDLQHDVPVFALVGRLHEAKGHTDLLPVLSDLAAADYNFHCLFVGEGELEASLKEESQRLKLDKHLVFTGFRSDVIGLLKAVDFLVMPSRWEGLPISLLESMACGSPVIASRVGGIPDVIEDQTDGLLYPQGDAKALASALQLMLENPVQRASMATRGAQKVQDHYSAATVAKAYEALYDEVT